MIQLIRYLSVATCKSPNEVLLLFLYGIRYMKLKCGIKFSYTNIYMYLKIVIIIIIIFILKIECTWLLNTYK